MTGLIERETCNHCPYKDVPGGCEGCLAGIAYDCAEERQRRIYKQEAQAMRFDRLDRVLKAKKRQQSCPRKVGRFWK